MAEGSDLPVVSPPFGERTREAPSGRLRVGGVLLAAGTSSRFGERNKLLATLDGDPLVRRAAQSLVDAGLDPVVVVVGHEADRVIAALDGLDVDFVTNDAYETGQASSVRAGISTLLQANRPVDAAVIALGDMPFVRPETIETMTQAYATEVGDALAAAHQGVRGNPVLFDRRFFEDLADVSGDTGGKTILLTSDASACIDVDDPGVRRDVDEPMDLD